MTMIKKNNQAIARVMADRLDKTFPAAPRRERSAQR
jgi:hypothetical protein